MIRQKKIFLNDIVSRGGDGQGAITYARKRNGGSLPGAPGRNREAHYACMDFFFLDGMFTAGATGNSHQEGE